MTQKPVQIAAIAIAMALLSLLTGFSQIKTEGLSWQEENYLPRLEAVAAGEAPAPMQYRLLTDRAVLAVCRISEAWGLPRPMGLAFVALRLAQNLALFALAFYYYHRLGIHAYAALLGLSAIAWGMTQANYGADLGFNAYTEFLLYLAAALALLEGRHRWIIPITVAAAFNRETSVLIPVMALAYALAHRPARQSAMEATRPASLALGAYLLIVASLALWYGARPWAGLDTAATPAVSYVAYNLGSHIAWGHAVGVLGVIPIMALWCYRFWHPLLRPVFWAVAPAWLIAHVLLSPLDQSRSLLLPQLLIFVPGLLYGIQQARERGKTAERGGVL